MNVACPQSGRSLTVDWSNLGRWRWGRDPVEGHGLTRNPVRAYWPANGIVERPLRFFQIRSICPGVGGRAVSWGEYGRCKAAQSSGIIKACSSKNSCGALDHQPVRRCADYPAGWYRHADSWVKPRTSLFVPGYETCRRCSDITCAYAFV